MHRIGIIPFNMQGELTALLFVTSQTRGRWILPKGLIKDGETHSDACSREAMEEAGVEGTIMMDFPLTVSINKKGEGGTNAVPVTYYPMLVINQVDEWPEMERRERHWALLKDTPKVVHREDYLALVKQFQALEPFIRKAVESSKS